MRKAILICAALGLTCVVHVTEAASHAQAIPAEKIELVAGPVEVLNDLVLLPEYALSALNETLPVRSNLFEETAWTKVSVEGKVIARIDSQLIRPPTNYRCA
jgi:hypothetical protein